MKIYGNEMVEVFTLRLTWKDGRATYPRACPPRITVFVAIGDGGAFVRLEVMLEEWTENCGFGRLFRCGSSNFELRSCTHVQVQLRADCLCGDGDIGSASFFAPPLTTLDVESVAGHLD